MSERELQIPVPWGIIAGKSWNDPCLKPVLLLHGIQDNLGSFERLLPHLPKTFFYLAVDLPGHGLSSRFPKGFPLDFINYVLSIHRIVRYQNWKSFIFIAHSLGGQIAQYYTAMFPEQVEKLVVIDAVGPTTIDNDFFLKSIRLKYELNLDLERKLMNGEPPSYSYEVALEKAIANRKTPITKIAAEQIIKRNLKQGKNGYYFAPDQRLKSWVTSPITHEQQLAHYANINCPFLLLIADSLSTVFTHIHNYKSILEVFQKNPLFKAIKVNGSHDVHNDDPEQVAEHISKFLLQPKSVL